MEEFIVCEAIFKPSPNYFMYFGLLTFKRIVQETNCYALSRGRNGQFNGGLNCIPLSMLELRALLAIILYMEVKKQPNFQLY